MLAMTTLHIPSKRAVAIVRLQRRNIAMVYYLHPARLLLHASLHLQCISSSSRKPIDVRVNFHMIVN